MLYKLGIAGKEISGFLVDSMGEFDALIGDLRLEDSVVVDLETTGLNPFLGDRLAGVALYLPICNTAYYVPFRHAEGSNLPLHHMKTLWETLRSVPEMIGWNFKFDLNFMYVDGYPTLNDDQNTYDSMVALHLLDENRYDKGANYKLKDAAAQLIDANAKDADNMLHDELKKRGIKKGLMYQLPPELVAEYAMMDTVLTWELAAFFKPYLDKWGQLGLYEETCDFERRVLHRMEVTGMLVDRDMIVERIAGADKAAAEKLVEIQAAAGYAINPNSPAQVASWLGLDNAQRETLELSGDPRAEMVIDYKFLAKAVSTFYQPYLNFSAGDSRIHPTLNVIGTVSGRLSSSEPNLQQVPRKAKSGKKGYTVKDVFTAPAGYVLAQFDYGQLELRLACHFAQEPKMTSMFNTGVDLHQYTADALGIDRQTGKTMNFGLLYGMGPEKAARFLRLELSEAKKLVPAWHALYPSFRAAHSQAIRIAQTPRSPSGQHLEQWDDNTFNYIRLPDGRVRHYYGAEAPFFSSWNTLIQGTGAIVMRRALMRIMEAYPDGNPVFIPAMTVHDSVIGYIKEEVVDEVVAHVVQLMTDFPEFNPPMTVDAKWGKSWGSV